MCAKMNWDRVRRENRVFQHGSAWIETGKVTDPPRSKPRARSKTSIQLGPPMLGCICGKTVGFTGAHKKQCLLSGRAPGTQKPRAVVPVHSLAQQAAPPTESRELTLSVFSNRLRNAVLNDLWKEFCQLQVKAVSSDKSLQDTARDELIGILKEFIQHL